MLRFSSGSHNHYHYHNKLDSRSATPSETDASVALWLLVQSIPDAFQSLKNPDRPRITSTSAVTTTTSSTSTESTSNPFADLFAGRNTPRRACCRMSLNGFVLLLMEEILHHLIGSLSACPIYSDRLLSTCSGEGFPTSTVSLYMYEGIQLCVLSTVIHPGYLPNMSHMAIITILCIDQHIWYVYLYSIRVYMYIYIYRYRYRYICIYMYIYIYMYFFWPIFHPLPGLSRRLGECWPDWNFWL